MLDIKGDAMHQSARAFVYSILLLGLLALTACPSQTTISKINQNPARYHDKDVALAGTVTDSYGALGTGAYELDDGTGRIWVVSTRGVPSKGTRVGTSGKVRTGVSFGGRNYGLVLQEEQRRTKTY
jgi:hypothetical protein